jgi:hypothetical protein
VIKRAEQAKIATNFTKQEKSKKFAKNNIQCKKDGKISFRFSIICALFYFILISIAF